MNNIYRAFCSESMSLLKETSIWHFTFMDNLVDSFVSDATKQQRHDSRRSLGDVWIHFHERHYWTGGAEALPLLGIE